MKLYYVILGATPKGRNIEQHDVYFGIAENLKDLVPEMKNFWSEANGKIHIDAYQEVQFVDGFKIKIVEKNPKIAEKQLFFINLGGYQMGKFEELHYQCLMVGNKMSEIIKRVKLTEFYQKMGFKSAESHVDEKLGVDIDDIYKVKDILSPEMKAKYSIILEKSEEENQENFTRLGYLMIDKIK